MTHKPGLPTPAELAILRVLWTRGASSVRDVHEEVGGETSYTTTLKLMQMMHAKGLLERDDAQRQHIYEAAVDETSSVGGLVNRFMTHVFGGSGGALALRALGEGSATPEELKELKRLIRDLERSGGAS
jgi:BlaI family transcriptional regulator, penicillinase repressor